MRLVMTMMVRDEADVIEAMVEHHFAQGVDTMLITDNGSIDGTTEILERLASAHDVVLMHDPVHAKQQSSCVTRMANEAYTEHGADWVINADADEFWVPRAHDSIHAAFETYPREFGAFEVHVEDMTGLPAARGTGLERLIYRDLRSTAMLRGVGLRDHSAADAVHIGASGVVVAQGNHAVSIPSCGTPSAAESIEVLHFPWRSWDQFRRKVENAGKAYESSPDLVPSPNHHGMRDYRLLKEGRLLASYLLRSLTPAQLDAGIADGLYVEETRIRAEKLPQQADDELEYDASEMVDLLRGLAATQGERLAATAADADQRFADAKAYIEGAGREWQAEREALHERADRLAQRVEQLSDELVATRAALEGLRGRRSVRIVDAVNRVATRRRA
ncbi:glycosyltransferase family 2 protein [Gryllotalpicola protaetiae]|uniref:Glycosyltransferase family 2 protein n=1 Tax=Gryllotalpicola protaetiae TaxID=2419771 RepID=A0A387BTA8_9MICO|nr:glycosyltransferase family 2 protein [Gryllotalpicola protaetiae]AYG04276.1 glycosyltransferase family 2 protein [Gryllotalpicola protaetiae]